jgi:hypothetical protein
VRRRLMSEHNGRRRMILAYVLLAGIGLIFPLGAILAGYWFFNVSLPTLMFISFVLLFLGSFVAYGPPPREDRPVTVVSEDTNSILTIFVILGEVTAVGVLILFFVRLFSQGLLFTWM